MNSGYSSPLNAMFYKVCMGYRRLIGAGRLPLARPTFSSTYKVVEAADSKSPFFSFEFVNRFWR
jgi:hypothetical protein